MTDSPQQQFFLEQFQKARDYLEEGDLRDALELLIEVRERGFVNKELDAMIDTLRHEPVEAMVEEAHRWVDDISQRLESYGGDVFQLVEEFSEASLGLSEADWVAVSDSFAEDMVGDSDNDLLSMEIEDLDADAFMDFDSVGADELDFDLDVDLDEDSSSDDELYLDDEFAFDDELDDELEFDDEDDDPPSVDFALVEGSTPSSDLAELTELSELSELSEASEVSDAPEGGNDAEDAPPMLSRHGQETKPHAAPAGDSEPSATAEPTVQPQQDRETRPNNAIDAESLLADGGANERETAKQKVAPKTARDVEESDENPMFDSEAFEDSEHELSAPEDAQFVDEPTRQSQSLPDLFSAGQSDSKPEPPEPASESVEPEEPDSDDEFDLDLMFDDLARGAGASGQPEAAEPPEIAEQPEARDEREDKEDKEDDEDDFDFDLGFENPAAKVESPGRLGPSPSSNPTPTPTPVPEPEPEPEPEEEEDDFDFDLGFENPAAKIESPNSPALGAEISGNTTPLPEPESEPEEEEDDFDFDLGFENPAAKVESPNTRSPNTRPQRTSTPSPAGPQPSESARDPHATPASMPSIPRFEPSGSQEETSPGPDETSPGPEEIEAEDSLDDDEFFELAESLSDESSSPSGRSGPYRGEPLMSASDTPVPSVELSEVSEPRERANTPNPFAHQAPTGVQQGLVDSNSSFVLEEIRESEASDAEDGEAAVGALMTEARRLYEEGKFESAHDLLEAVMGRDPDNEDARELVSVVEGELERQYQRQLGALSKTPQLEVAMSDIPTMNLDHRFGFLLSQIDGMSSFEDILELSSMTRLETLEVLVAMLERDLISVG